MRRNPEELKHTSVSHWHWVGFISLFMFTHIMKYLGKKYSKNNCLKIRGKNWKAFVKD